RELDDALLLLRANEHEIGALVLKTRGDPAHVLKSDEIMAAHRGHWFVREVIASLRRTLRRLDLCGKSLFALIDEGSCFAGTLFELALAADRSYMLAGGDDPPAIALGPFAFGGLEMANGQTRLLTRFHEAAAVAALAPLEGHLLDAAAAEEHGLVTFAPDELDWGDEIRLAIEERASLSPDALSGLEANLRFAGPETLATRIAGRLSAWQNWVFLRPNAAGPEGALKSYGSGRRPRFDRERI
ncbi:MAG: 2,3-epoxybenzoyl-CoA dihydrolase, partial [Stellaceae bacterium]